ncbi:MAG: hypothetical protein ABFC96_01610 [Thermoguttaceae bacterium]
MVPGNHDIDLDGIGHNAKMLHAQLREGTPNSIQADLESLAKESKDEPHPLFRKLNEYNIFASGYGCDFQSVAKPICQRDYHLGGENMLRFLGLTTVQVSDKQDAKGKMVLGNAQYSFQRVPNVAHVVMAHHPLDWCRDHQMAENSIYSRARVAIFGHEHVPKIIKVSDQDGGWERIVIDSGATTPPGDEDAYEYTYNWLEFALEARDGLQHLILTVFPRVWSETKTTFVADHSRMTLDGNESAKFSLVCRDLSVAPEPAPVVAVSPQVTCGIVPAHRAGVKEEGGPVAEQDYRFARLRLLFWRHLNWRQRLNVLVQLDILPQTADRPMPQTIERLAIERARTERRLHPLWQAIVQFLPENERAENPFAPNE